jgi:hypothetical protein
VKTNNCKISHKTVLRCIPHNRLWYWVHDPANTAGISPLTFFIVDPEHHITQILFKLIMYRNVYDTDVTTWSPQGRLHQTEYAMEGVKLGTCAVGVRSDTHVVSCRVIILKNITNFTKTCNKLLYR